MKYFEVQDRSQPLGVHRECAVMKNKVMIPET